MKLIFSKLGLLLLLLSLYKPTNAQIEKEILAYVDSSKTIINNGRHLLELKVSQYDYKSTNEIYYYLQEKAVKQGELAFTFAEIIYINLITGNYGELIDYCKHYEQKIQLPVFKANYNLKDPLYKHLKETEFDIKTSLETSTINQEAKDLITIILHVIYSSTTDNNYRSLLNNFSANYPNSEYYSFIKNYLPDAPFLASFSWNVGPNMILFDNNIRSLFDPKLGFVMGLNININKVYSSLYMKGGFMHPSKDFSHPSYNFSVNDEFSYFDAGLQLGYFMCRNEHFHIAPYISIGGTQLNSNLYNSENDRDEYDIINSFMYGIGLHTEVKLLEFESSGYWYGFYGSPYIKNKQFLALKLNAGYNIQAKSLYEQFAGNTFYTSFSFVWGIGIF